MRRRVPCVTTRRGGQSQPGGPARLCPQSLPRGRSAAIRLTSPQEPTTYPSVNAWKHCPQGHDACAQGRRRAMVRWRGPWQNGARAEKQLPITSEDWNRRSGVSVVCEPGIQVRQVRAAPSTRCGAAEAIELLCTAGVAGSPTKSKGPPWRAAPSPIHNTHNHHITATAERH
jgi:hypothetical protein